MIRTQELVERSGVTSRTLRYYDQIGLLKPATSDAGGQRWYGDAEVLRLQRILVLRELGLPLGQIARVLDGETNDVDALRDHVTQLSQLRARTDRMIHAVQRTIERLENGAEMDTNEMFDGFTDDRYAAEAEQKWPEQYADSQKRVGRLSTEQQRELVARGEVITRRMGDLLQSGELAESVAAQSLIAEHYHWICAFWTPNLESYQGLGHLYVDDPRFAATYEAIAPGLARFMCDAMEAWAERNLDL